MTYSLIGVADCKPRPCSHDAAVTDSYGVAGPGYMVVLKSDIELITRHNVSLEYQELVDRIRGSLRHVALSPDMDDVRELDAIAPDEILNGLRQWKAEKEEHATSE